MLEDMSIESISRIKELDKNKSNLARFKFDKNLLFFDKMVKFFVQEVQDLEYLLKKGPILFLIAVRFLPKMEEFRIQGTIKMSLMICCLFQL